MADRGCGPDGPDSTYYHVSVEGWTLGYGTAWDEIQASYPRTAPKNLGSSGYMGYTGQYLAAEIVDVALQVVWHWSITAATIFPGIILADSSIQSVQ